VVIALLVLFAGFSIALPDTFFTLSNVKTTVNSQATVLFLALAATIPLRAGDFDLSIGAVMTFAAALTGRIVLGGSSPVVALIAVLVFGLLVGLIHGLLVVRIGVNSFVVTLGTMTLLGGLAYALTNTEIITSFPQSLLDISRTEFLGLPAMTWYAWLAVAVLWYIYDRTPVGRFLLFTGGNTDAARLAGLRTGRLRTGAFVGSAMLSSVAGFLLASSIGSVDPSISGQFLLQPFAAAFLGATTIAVGRFNALGTLFGLYFLAVGITGLQLYGAQPWVSNVFNGTALVVAVTLARLAERTRAGRGRSA
jgi:ribose transport system permease protein